MADQEAIETMKNFVGISPYGWAGAEVMADQEAIETVVTVAVGLAHGRRRGDGRSRGH